MSQPFPLSLSLPLGGAPPAPGHRISAGCLPSAAEFDPNELIVGSPANRSGGRARLGRITRGNQLVRGWRTQPYPSSTASRHALGQPETSIIPPYNTGFASPCHSREALPDKNTAWSMRAEQLPGCELLHLDADTTLPWTGYANHPSDAPHYVEPPSLSSFIPAVPVVNGERSPTRAYPPVELVPPPSPEGNLPYEWSPNWVHGQRTTFEDSLYYHATSPRDGATFRNPDWALLPQPPLEYHCRSD
ncbi:hypothetical protein OH77DRAFT_1421663, partial [Trametes cingulata]